MTKCPDPSLLCVVGARPNFMKISPVMKSLKSLEVPHPIITRLVHTGQHYDAAMKHCFFDQLGIPEPDVDLEVGSASHAVQTAEIMRRFEPVLDSERPDAVLVVGDVNSTIACAMVSVKKGVPVVHVEAGLRSFDRRMPEEINRVLTDQISELLFITEKDAHVNLVKEGIDPAKIHFVGNVMIDTLLDHLPKAVPLSQTLQTSSHPAVFLSDTGYGVLTLHRPSNVDDPRVLENILEAVRQISRKLPLVFPVHPRTLERIKTAGCESILETNRILQFMPLGYLEMLGLMSRARLVLTDSGGMQEETTALGVPCITLRENTERPITLEQGTNTLVGTDPDRIISTVDGILNSGGKAGRIPELWDGKAADRIASTLYKWLTEH